MHNASLAERLLCLITTRERASSIAGDLIEENAHRGPVHFWLALSTVFFSLGWRWFFAFILFFTCDNIFIHLMQAIGIFQGGLLNSQIADPFRSAVMALSVIGVTLWRVSAFFTICYGVRDSFTRFTLMMTLFVTLILCSFWSRPLYLFGCAAILLFFTLVDSRYRRMLTSLAGILLVSSGLLLVPLLIGTVMSIAKLPQGAFKGLSPVSHLPWPALFFGTCIAFILTVSVSSAVHRNLNPEVHAEA